MCNMHAGLAQVRLCCMRSRCSSNNAWCFQSCLELPTAQQRAGQISGCRFKHGQSFPAQQLWETALHTHIHTTVRTRWHLTSTYRPSHEFRNHSHKSACLSVCQVSHKHLTQRCLCGLPPHVSAGAQSVAHQLEPHTELLSSSCCCHHQRRQLLLLLVWQWLLMRLLLVSKG